MIEKEPNDPSPIEERDADVLMHINISKNPLHENNAQISGEAQEALEPSVPTRLGEANPQTVVSSAHKKKSSRISQREGVPPTACGPCVQPIITAKRVRGCTQEAGPPTVPPRFGKR